MPQPARLARLVAESVERLRLDLAGVTVLTEAATGAYAATAALAAAAGAERVLAVARRSRHGSAATAAAQTRAVARLCGVEDRLAVHPLAPGAPLPDAWLRRTGLVTNLGAVRPLDARAIRRMPPGGVISLMCEAWELRPGDVDVDACRERGVLLYATNEHAPSVDVFAYSGWLCQKLLFDARIELHHCRIVVAGGDAFAAAIDAHLRRAGIDTVRVATLREAAPLADADALVVADYTREDWILGPGGDLECAELARRAPALTVVVFAGRVDARGLRARGLHVHPPAALPARRMAETFAALGPRPVIELHAAGLKVGQLAARIARDGATGLPASELAHLDLLQPIVAGA
jgi:hypothetical protein